MKLFLVTASKVSFTIMSRFAKEAYNMATAPFKIFYQSRTKTVIANKRRVVMQSFKLKPQQQLVPQELHFSVDDA